MKYSISILLCTALAALGSEQVPKKAPISRYTPLWTNSPFTSKPPPVADSPKDNPLDSYALAGVSPIESGGYRVLLIEKKQPDNRITVDTGDSRSGFKIISVTRKLGDPMGTVVKMSSGANVGTVSYDEKLLTLVSAPKAAPGGNIPNPQAQNGQPPQIGNPGGNGAMRQPRPRVVPPPTATPQPNGGPQIQQGQPAPQNNQRPERRRN